MTQKKIRVKLRIVACVLTFLLLSLPFSFAEQLSLVYDNNGNLISGDGKYRQYNEFNQLIRIRNGSAVTGKILEEYIYHPTEERVLAKRVYNLDSVNAVNQTVIYPNENLVRTVTYPAANQVNTSDKIYVKDESGLAAEIGARSQKLFYSSNHKGSNSVLTNSTQGIVEQTFYEPFGGIVSGGSVSRFDYEGKEFSAVTGEYDFFFRKYNPNLLIFVKPEQLLPNVYDPQLLNRYSFERQNPYKHIDPDGNYPLLIVAGGAGLINGVGDAAFSYFILGNSVSESIASGAITGTFTFASVATFGAFSTTAAGAIGLRYVTTTGGRSVAQLSSEAAIGGLESIAKQTNIEGKSFGDLSSQDIIFSATGNVIPTRAFSRLPGVITRGSGQVYPSSGTSRLFSEAKSQGIISFVGDKSSYIGQKSTNTAYDKASKMVNGIINSIKNPSRKRQKPQSQSRPAGSTSGGIGYTPANPKAIPGGGICDVNASCL